MEVCHLSTEKAQFSTALPYQPFGVSSPLRPFVLSPSKDKRAAMADGYYQEIVVA